MDTQQTITEQYNQVEATYKKFLLDVRESGLESPDRWVWYTRAYICLNRATADAQITALNAVRAQWDQRNEAAKMQRESTRLAISRILGGTPEWTTSENLYHRLERDGNPLSDEDTASILADLIAENIVQEVKSGIGFSFFRLVPIVE